MFFIYILHPKNYPELGSIGSTLKYSIHFALFGKSFGNKLKNFIVVSIDEF
ncbi:hypothetical protein NO004_440028 [Flavobacterium psychrophilum]|nr:hypothetical protein NO004_440028 [Flavobacterium psychrophilum]SNB95195.1 hypothetical protein FPC840_1220001 [Flavobacterium psychrophilum]